MKEYHQPKIVNELNELDLSSTYNYANYLKWAFDERVEIVKGRLFKMTPAPSRIHQKISWAVSRVISKYLDGKKCEAYTAPFDVRLPRKSKEDKEIFTVVQPDMCVICDPSKLDDRGCIGAPDIVVEILSPGNNKKELQNKYEVYEESGVKEYWIVWPEHKTFLKYTLNVNGKYQPSRVMTVGEEVDTPILPGFVLKLEEVFQD
jgi:Uma2 family endonuclease